MKSLRFLLISISCFLIITLYYFRNHFRLLVMSRYPPAVSVIKKISTREEQYFNATIYQCRRLYHRRPIAWFNDLYSDKLLVIRMPIKQFVFNNLVLPPVGKDEISTRTTFYFNTLFFDQEYIATTGVIDDKEIINRRPRKRRVGLDQNGNLTIFSSGRNAGYNDVFQAPYILKRNTRPKGNFNTLNYRQFIAVRNNELIYISGYNNSLISWKDVRALMQQMNLESVIALDGGASLDYFFEGKNNSYSFSSIPFRWFWFYLNSPYYLEGKLKY